MSATTTTNVHQTLAIQLSNLRPPTIEEQIFRDALEHVKTARKAKGDLPEVFDNLRSAKTVQDVNYCIEYERQRSHVWKDKLGTSWLSLLGEHAQKMWHWKVFADGMANINQEVGSPIWGTLAFAISVLKDFVATAEQLNNIQASLERTIPRFEDYLRTHKEPSINFKKCLCDYYSVVLELAIDVHKVFSKSRTKVAIDLLHRKLQGELVDFNSKVYSIVYDVDQAERLQTSKILREETRHNHNTVINILTKSAALPTSTPQSQTRAISSNFHPLSQRFTGQTRYLKAIWTALNMQQRGFGGHSSNSGHSPSKQAIYGMGGIGKTQILLKYAYDRFYRDKGTTALDVVVYIHAQSKDAVHQSVSSFMQTYALHEVSQKGVIDAADYSSFHQWLLNREKWLLVFDDVRDYGHVYKAIPQIGNGQVLFSTRHQLLARDLAPETAPLEITAMEYSDQLALISRFVESSTHPSDREDDTIRQVAKFAGGVPLVIEQLCHNAMLGKAPLPLLDVLVSVRNRRELLKQKNISSLHADQLSLGAVVSQKFYTIQSESEEAVALLKILAYLEPSTIPLSMLKSGAKQLQAFLNRPYTYDRGQTSYQSGQTIEQRELPNPLQAQHAPRGRQLLSPKTWLPLRSRSASKARSAVDLPIDDGHFNERLRASFVPDTAVNRLFTHPKMIETAVRILCDIIVIKQTNDILWMHDLVSKVSKALIEEKSKEDSQNMLLLATTTVYLALPHPGTASLQPMRGFCQIYIPHAIACHDNLKAAGILNDSSIGPELSHVIASSMHVLGMDIHDHNGKPFLNHEQRANEDRIVNYYQQAYAGYMAGWHRLKLQYNVSHTSVVLSTQADRAREIEKQRFYHHLRYVGSSDHERFGRSAPWRAIQVASKLSFLLEDRPESLQRAMQYSCAVLKFSTLTFGPNDEDTICARMALCRQLTAAEHWEESYEVCLRGLKDWVGWHTPSSQVSRKKRNLRRARKQNRRISWKRLTTEVEGAQFCEHAAKCCLKLAESYPQIIRDSSTQDTSATAFKHSSMAASEVPGNWVNLAILYSEINLRSCIHRYRDFYGIYLPMAQLSRAYEAAGRGQDAVYWMGNALCVGFNVEIKIDNIVADTSGVDMDDDEELERKCMVEMLAPYKRMELIEQWQACKSRWLDEVVLDRAGGGEDVKVHWKDGHDMNTDWLRWFWSVESTIECWMQRRETWRKKVDADPEEYARRQKERKKQESRDWCLKYGLSIKYLNVDEEEEERPRLEYEQMFDANGKYVGLPTDIDKQYERAASKNEDVGDEKENECHTETTSGIGVEAMADTLDQRIGIGTSSASTVGTSAPVSVV